MRAIQRDFKFVKTVASHISNNILAKKLLSLSHSKDHYQQAIVFLLLGGHLIPSLTLLLDINT